VVPFKCPGCGCSIFQVLKGNFVMMRCVKCSCVYDEKDVSEVIGGAGQP